MMLNVLVLAYHFPPSNSSAAHRPDSWARHGKKFGINPTIVTRHWTGLENDWLNFAAASGTTVTVEQNEQCEIIRLPYKDISTGKGKLWKRKSVTRKLYYLFKALSGDFHTQANVMETFRPYLIDLLKHRKFDYIIATAPPYQLLELAAELGKRFQLPFVADIRDLWNDNKSLKVHARWTFQESLHERVSRHYIKKWVKPATLITAVSAPLGEVAGRGTSTPFCVVTNGYERDVYKTAMSQNPNEFTITLTGTIYPEQEFDVLLLGFQKFLETRPKAKIHFIGVAILPEMAQKVKNSLPSEFINVQARIPKQEAINLTVSSHVLFYVGWKGYRGFYSGKIFEYLAARKNILIAPSDKDVIEELLVESEAGRVANTPEEVAALLSGWYKEWETSGTLTYNGKEEVIRRYSREEQTRKLAEELIRIHSKREKN